MNYTVYYTTLTMVAVVVYLISTEPNFLRFVDIQNRIFFVTLRKYFILIRLYPRVKWDIYMMKRRMKALKRKLKESKDE